MSKYVVAIVGATGVVGRELVRTLEERNFPVKELRLLASERSLGQSMYFQGAHVEVTLLEDKAFKGVDFALFSAGGSLSKKFCPAAVMAGAVCIDNTSHYRMDPKVPLIVPEVNSEALKGHNGIIANPNCSTAQLVLALKPIHEKFGIKRIVCATYQSVSGAGKAAINEMEEFTRINLAGGFGVPEIFTHDIAFNVIPRIDVFEKNGYTKEEMKMVNETRKILGDESIRMSVTCARVPVFVGHSEAVNVETEKPISADKVRKLLSKAPGVEVADSPEMDIYPTPRDVAGQDDVFVGRIREDISVENGVEFWVVGDNLRKGAALNAVQIAEALVQKK